MYKYISPAPDPAPRDPYEYVEIVLPIYTRLVTSALPIYKKCMRRIAHYMATRKWQLR